MSIPRSCQTELVYSQNGFFSFYAAKPNLLLSSKHLKI